MADVPEAIRLAVGDSREIVLPGLGTAGYRWADAVAGDPGVVRVSWRRGFAAEERGDRPVGASAPERVTLTGNAPGRASVRLTQARPWERGAPRAEHTIQVLVEPSGDEPAARAVPNEGSTPWPSTSTG